MLYCRRVTLFLTVLALPVLAHASTWELDPAHTNAHFAVKHLVISTVRGHLGKVTGTLTLDENDPTKSSVQATIDAAGVDTGNAKRDEHLKGPDFLDVAKYPTITFKSKTVEKISDDHYRATGDLTLRGVTKEVALDVHGAPKPLNDPFGNVKLGGEATTTINRQNFGVSWSKALDGGGLVVGDDVEVMIDVELLKK
jgi:polyisoprenoid-binding protein YceI